MYGVTVYEVAGPPVEGALQVTIRRAVAGGGVHAGGLTGRRRGANATSTQ